MKLNKFAQNGSSRFDARRFGNYRALSFIYWLATLLAIGIVVAFVRSLYLDYAVNVVLEKRYSSMRASGEVFDSASMQAYYLAKTTPKNREEWADMLGIANSRWAGDIVTAVPITGSDLDPEPFAPHASEAKKKQAIEVLNELSPVITRLRELSKEAEPLRFHDDPEQVWRDSDTFMLARAGARVLSLDFQFAVSENDSSRAFEDWKAIQACSKIILGDCDMVHAMVAEAINGIGRYYLRLSLRKDFWSDDQLESLYAGLAVPLDLPKNGKVS